MALTYGFYNSVNHDRRYFTTQFSNIVNAMITDGVFLTRGNAFAVTPAANGLGVNVDTGFAWFTNTWTENDQILVLQLADADVSRPRIDAIVLDVNGDDDIRENNIIVITGEPYSTPTKPTLINEGKHTQHALAYVTVNANATSITSESIELVVGQNETPYADAKLSGIDITALFQQWQGEFDSWFAEIKDLFNVWDKKMDDLYIEGNTKLIEWGDSVSEMLMTVRSDFDTDVANWTNQVNTAIALWDTEFDDFVDARDAEFTAWFDNLQAMLDENVVTNLQNQITNLKDTKVNKDDKATQQEITDATAEKWIDAAGFIAQKATPTNILANTPKKWIDPESFNAVKATDEDIRNGAAGKWVSSDNDLSSIVNDFVFPSGTMIKNVNGTSPFTEYEENPDIVLNPYSGPYKDLCIPYTWGRKTGEIQTLLKGTASSNASTNGVMAVVGKYVFGNNGINHVIVNIDTGTVVATFNNYTYGFTYCTDYEVYLGGIYFFVDTSNKSNARYEISIAVIDLIQDNVEYYTSGTVYDKNALYNAFIDKVGGRLRVVKIKNDDGNIELVVINSTVETYDNPYAYYRLCAKGVKIILNKNERKIRYVSLGSVRSPNVANSSSIYSVTYGGALYLWGAERSSFQDACYKVYNNGNTLSIQNMGVTPIMDDLFGVPAKENVVQQNIQKNKFTAYSFCEINGKIYTYPVYERFSGYVYGYNNQLQIRCTPIIRGGKLINKPFISDGSLGFLYESTASLSGYNHTIQLKRKGTPIVLDRPVTSNFLDDVNDITSDTTMLTMYCPTPLLINAYLTPTTSQSTMDVHYVTSWITQPFAKGIYVKK